MFNFQIVKPALTTILALGIISAQGIPSVLAEGLNNNVRLFTGEKQLDKDDWQSMESQGEFGLLMDFKKQEWPISIALDLFVSASDSYADDLINERGYTSEIHLGARKIWDLQAVDIHPYIGGGIAFIGAGFELRESQGEIKEDDSDSSIGTWLGAGAYWNITSSFNVGLDVRYSFSEVTIFDKDIEVGGMHAGLTVGFSF